MPSRFHLPEIDVNGRGELDEDETHHLRHVMRLGVGAEIEVFNGRGDLFHARVAALGRTTARVEVTGAATAAAEPRTRITLVISVLKGDKMDAVIRDATMMGVAVIQPVVATRTEIRLASFVSGERHGRWLRVAIASVKQCGRAVVPEIRPVLDLPGWLTGHRGEPPVVLVEPKAGPGTTSLALVEPGDHVALATGPEGGWTAEELDAFRAADARLVSLGSRTLRAETAPLVAIAALYASWHAW